MATQQGPATIKQTQILYYVMYAGQIMIGSILFFNMKDAAQTDVVAPFDMIIPGAVVFGIMASYLINQRRSASIPINGTVQEKIDHYRTSGIMKFAIAEGGNLVSLVLTFVMANTNYLMWFGIGLAAFILHRPSRDQFIEKYQIAQGTDFE